MAEAKKTKSSSKKTTKKTTKKAASSSKASSLSKAAAGGMITRVSGPVVYARLDAAVNDMVEVGEQKLLGEVIELRGEICIIQVYEDTTGVKPGEPVANTQVPLSVELAPGIMGQVFDGTQRPLDVIQAEHGFFIPRGINPPALDRKRKWHFVPTVKKGDTVTEGQVLGTVQETTLIMHKVLVPIGMKGTVGSIKEGQFTIEETIATLKDGSENYDVMMLQRWPVRKARPAAKRLPISGPLISGQRVLDFMFPIARGGVGAIPGPFGSGKTVTQQQFAKWSDADIIVYIGCGERGNEMTEVLTEFPELKDPKSGKPLMDRTILIANTSNMPVAAREACVYTGITIAEYFRDQGYAVALMADSTSRWAEAMREISGRLEEMPGEEGYPAYLSKRLAEFYERAGSVQSLSGDEGSVSVIGAVSPPGGDFSEPVTQNTLRITKCFWALDAGLANKRHYPAINWLNSYSLYTPITDKWFDQNISKDWSGLRKRAQKILQVESELQEVVQLVGLDSLPKKDQLLLLAAKMVREDFLQQHAFHPEDTFCPMIKQVTILRLIFAFYDAAAAQVEHLSLETLRLTDFVEQIAQLKYRDNKEFSEDTIPQIEEEFETIHNASIQKAVIDQ